MMTEQEWVNSIGDTDLPLKLAREACSKANAGIETAKATKNVVRAERRLCVKYAPIYTNKLLTHQVGASLIKTGEYDAFYASVERGE